MELTVHHVDGMRFLATADSHSVVVDAAPEDGGGGTAISAPQLFVAALGACILEFVLNSCRLRDVPVERLSLALTYEEIPGPRRLDSLQVRLQIEPEPPDEVRRRIIGVARHATLANTLVRPLEIQIEFAREGDSDAGLAPAGTVLEYPAGEEA